MTFVSQQGGFVLLLKYSAIFNVLEFKKRLNVVKKIKILDSTCSTL